LRIAIAADDLILLCSDGLTGMVSDSEITRILRGGGSLEHLAQHLVTAANGAGGEDNVTAVLLRMGTRGVEDTEPERPPIVILPPTALTRGPLPVPTTPESQRRRGVSLLAVGIVAAVGVVLAVAIAIGLQWAHFVGATPTGRVAIYQGLPFEVTSDVTLYRAITITDVPTAVLSADQRATLLDQRIGSLGSAEDRVATLTSASPWLRLPPSAP